MLRREMPGLAFSVSKQAVYSSGVNARLDEHSSTEEKAEAHRAHEARTAGVALTAQDTARREVVAQVCARERSSMALRRALGSLLTWQPAAVDPKASFVWALLYLVGGVVCCLSEYELTRAALAALFGWGEGATNTVLVSLSATCGLLLLELLLARRLYTGSRGPARSGAVALVELGGVVLAIALLFLLAWSREQLMGMVTALSSMDSTIPQLDNRVLQLLVLALTLYVALAAALMFVHGRLELAAAGERSRVHRTQAKLASKLQEANAHLDRATDELARVVLERTLAAEQAELARADMMAQVELEALRVTRTPIKPEPPPTPPPADAFEALARVRAERQSGPKSLATA